jgi:hypothetical protein
MELLFEKIRISLNSGLNLLEYVLVREHQRHQTQVYVDLDVQLKGNQFDFAFLVFYFFSHGFYTKFLLMNDFLILLLIDFYFSHAFFYLTFFFLFVFIVENKFQDVLDEYVEILSLGLLDALVEDGITFEGSHVHLSANLIHHKLSYFEFFLHFLNHLETSPISLTPDFDILVQPVQEQDIPLIIQVANWQ